MQQRMLSAGVVSLALLLGSCTTPLNMGSQIVRGVTQSTSQILGDLVVINKNEMAAARLAEKKAHSPAVKHFAAYLYREHKDNLARTMRLSRMLRVPFDTTSALASGLTTEGQAFLGSLQQATGSVFDETYINGMINDHQKAQSLLGSFLNTVTDPLLQTHLTQTKAHVAKHLVKAEAIKNNLR